MATEAEDPAPCDLAGTLRRLLNFAQARQWSDLQLAHAIAAIVGPVVTDTTHAPSNSVAELIHLATWSSGRRPVWWADVPVRTFVAGLHREMTIDAALDACRERFGASRAPKRTSLASFWKRLDQARGMQS